MAKMTSDSVPYTLSAEWEGQNAVLLTWPHAATDWAYMLEDIQECYRGIIRAITRYAKVIAIVPEKGTLRDLQQEIGADRLYEYACRTNDTWIRDYGPITTMGSDGRCRLLDYKFNGWGLKFAADHDNLVTRNLIDNKVIAGAEYVNKLSFVLEGGSIDSDGKGNILTTDSCLCSPNRNGGMTKEQILKSLGSELGAKNMISLKHGELRGDDTDGHIDTIARFAPDDTIIYAGCNDPTHHDFAQLQALKAELHELHTILGHPVRLIELPSPGAVLDPDDGAPLPATYANFLIINKAVLVPQYRRLQADALALEAVAEAFPGYHIVPLDCLPLVRQHGSLHCATMQIPENIIDYAIIS